MLSSTTATDVDDEQVYLAPTEDHFDGNGQVAKRVRNAGTGPAEIVNYSISLSVLGRVVTETNGTGAKLKTFVQANGALLAEQVVTEYEQTNYEILRFVHQDASGSGVQQTLANGTLAIPNGRTAEYDAMGRNVADPGPYVLLNTQVPSENGSGIDLFGNGEGYRPGRVTYTYHGMVVPESFARELINSGEIGGAFGLLQIAARMSIRGEGGATTFDPSEGEVDDETPSEWRDYDTSWTVITSIIPFVQIESRLPQTRGPAPLNEDENKKLDTRIEKIKERLAGERCKKFLTSKLGPDAIGKLIATLNDQALRFSAGRSNEITVEQAGVYGEGARSSLELQLLSARRSERENIRTKLKTLDLTVSEWVRLPENRGIRAFVGAGQSVYYVDFNSVTAIIHENLHISTGKGDRDLACLLGAGCNSRTAREASPKISEILQKNGCT